MTPEMIAAAHTMAPEIDDAKLAAIYEAMVRLDRDDIPRWLVGATVAFTAIVLVSLYSFDRICR